MDASMLGGYRAGMTRLGVAALFALLLTACGNDEGGDSEVADAIDSMPKCADIWVAGETLPEDYEGCETGDAISAPAVDECVDGSTWTSYDDRFYAKYGGEIVAVEGEMSSDPAYSAFYDECLGG